MKKNIKFKSLFGFALTEAKKKGDRVVVGFQFNINDEYPNESKLTQILHMLDDIVYPEIMLRITNKTLESSFKLNKAHIILFSKESNNHILLNDEVRIKANVTFVNGKILRSGQPVGGNDIEQILGLYPNEKNDPNAAHIMLFKFKGNWKIAVDLIYDREKVRKKFNSANNFLKSAEFNFKHQLWDSFADNLFSVTELTIQSILLLRHYGGYSRNQTHQKTREIFDRYCKNGNAPLIFLKHYDKMFELRKKGRYSNGVHGKQFTINENEAKQHIDTTKNMIDHVANLLHVIDYKRSPTLGDYIELGNI